MAASNINRVVLTGNLTKDPDLRALPTGASVCEMRIGVNSRRRSSGDEWIDKPNYFNVKVFGAHGENCARFLTKGRPVAIDGRLEWREWDAQDGSKRQVVEIIADNIQFLGSSQATVGDGAEYIDEFTPVPIGVGAEEGAHDESEHIPF